MTIVGEFPEQGVRVTFARTSLTDATIEYAGEAVHSETRSIFRLSIERATGNANITYDQSCNALKLIDEDVAFVRQLAKQLWRHAEHTPIERGGGQWPRKVQRWRGPK